VILSYVVPVFKNESAAMKHAVRPKKRGFTLIELLVVISIISLLVAFLLPAVSRAREQGRRALCLANQRQYGISVNIYGNDSKGYYPGIINLGQGMMQDGAITPMYLSYQWMIDSNRVAAEYIPKAITACPSADPRYATNRNEWTNAGNGVYWGTTDYSLKVGFGSNHIALDANGYHPAPSAANLWSFRGFYDWRFYRKYSGFFFNYRQEQRNFYGNPTQSNKAIMIMDRQRSPVISASDINNAGTYKMYKSNHEMVSDPNGAAEGANALLVDGSARWMNLSAIWGRADLDSKFYYDIAGYAEGSYPQYVDEQMAENWP
jgi:prepilin-type N-terminal cleavage/methylation domain-containing protein